MALMFEPLRKYATFSGRARRLEYWLWQVFLTLASLALAFWLVAAMPAGWEGSSAEDLQAAYGLGGSARMALWAIMIFSLAMILPSLAVSVRRLHDSDKSGWWVLLGLTGIGSVVLFIFFLLDGTQGPNRYGPDPKGRPARIYG
jgi:uncharacterized membrane protein YhaH (DUF805 family)